MQKFELNFEATSCIGTSTIKALVAILRNVQRKWFWVIEDESCYISVNVSHHLVYVMFQIWSMVL